MVNLLVGFISSILILSLYSTLEKKRVSKIGKTKYIFTIFVLFSAYVFHPTSSFFYWALWMLMFYTVLDDLKTQTVFTPIYIVVLISLFFKGHPFEEFLFAVLMFIIFLLFSSKTKETFFSIGDCFLIWALSFWMGKVFLVALLLGTVLAGVILPIVSIFTKRKYFPFSIFLVAAAVIVQSNWHVGIILLVGILINAFILLVNFFLFLGMRIQNMRQKNQKIKKDLA